MLIDGSTNDHNVLAQVNFKIPSRSTRSRVPFSIPIHSTDYRRNQSIDHIMMHLANEDAGSAVVDRT